MVSQDLQLRRHVLPELHHGVGIGILNGVLRDVEVLETLKAQETSSNMLKMRKMNVARDERRGSGCGLGLRSEFSVPPILGRDQALIIAASCAGIVSIRFGLM